MHNAHVQTPALALVQKNIRMTLHDLSSRSRTSLKHTNKKHDEKYCILKMCRKKLRVLEKKDSIAKAVLIRNTLKIVETQSISDSFYESEEEKENFYIDALLRELDDYNHQQLSSSKPICQVTDSVTSLKSEVLEDFHNSETFSSNKLVLGDEDLSTLIELTQNQST